MPSRKKPTFFETKEAVNRSLLEWGVQPTRNGVHSNFSRTISHQAIGHSVKKNGPVLIDDARADLPRDLEKAIQMVFVADLNTFLDADKFKQRSREAEDNLKHNISSIDDDYKILQLPPYYVPNYQVTAIVKPSFARFAAVQLDPFHRFKLKVSNVSPAKLAYEHCSQKGWLNGYSFEAIVASHAIHNEVCFRCKKLNSLRWCGGSNTSWRDLYCVSCQSCFEIKSKDDKKAIDRIFKFDTLRGGSFRR
jgi:hypothetical protein